MLRILKKTTSSMVKTGRSVPAERFGAVDEEDLSAWEFVNASQSDDEDRYSFDDDEGVISGGDDVIVDDEPESMPDLKKEEGASEPRGVVTPADVISIQSMSVLPPMTLPVEMKHTNPYRFDGKGRRYYGENDDGSDEDDGDAHDFDDDLVPWKLKDRFGKQKMKKVGKKGGPNANSKRLPYYYNLPGTVYGKVRC